MAHADLLPELEPFRNALSRAWVSQGQQLTKDDDIYSGSMHGLVKCVSTIYKGKRSSSWTYLVGKNNVTVFSQAHSKCLVIENNKAVGITVFGADGNEHTFRAKHEVIVSSGVFETPKLLKLSGVGPKEELAAHGIKTLVDSPHVGENLLDHPILPHVFKLKEGYGLDNHLLRAGPMKEGAVSAYRARQSGPLSSGLLELAGFPRIDEYLATSKEYVDYKNQNGGVDPFGPGGQPHFEIDFVV